MMQQEFEGLVQRLTAESKRAPHAYALRVGLLAAAGYGYIFFVTGVLLAASVALAVLMI